MSLPDEAGHWRKLGADYEIAFERHLRHPPERVWAALTTPEGLSRWLANAVIEPEPGGRMDLTFTQPDAPELPVGPGRRQANRVIRFEPHTLFEHSFGDDASVVCWRLEPDGNGTRLTLTHRVPSAWGAKVLSGWHLHLEGLDDAIAGRTHAWRWDRWRALHRSYGAEVAQ